MKINIRSENTNFNMYILYKIENWKRKKIRKNLFNDNEVEQLIETNEIRKLILGVYPKYYSKFKWLLVWLLLSFVELFGTSFGSFGSDSKMYKEFIIEFKEELSELNICFNGSRFDLSSIEDIVISEKIKGKFLAIIISVLGLMIWILLIFIIILIQILSKK